ncbi:Uncharacterised protein [Mycobacteroides abscessus subsp. bolletii]|uniref:hypothetical protein n=1 Tax=Mycobacteroides abscessus TaxID=36809 RepID=UPI0009A5F4AF|nr:hypothetical protein [Mycobacteroides abscessus]SKG68561.1 Uncharacterised protein [Mycobacteroides abscessus subsp. bolletii]SLF40232.1 Uncharacterised protein [Mycobacteroides abscessus subsp. bolletii]
MARPAAGGDSRHRAEQDELMLTVSHRVPRAAEPADALAVAQAVRPILGGVVLPFTELSGYRGYPIVQWNTGLNERLRAGLGPMLDRPTLSLWECWPTGSNSAPPAAPLRIVGFASTATWRHAMRATRALRGFGSTIMVCDRRPSPFRLAEADFSSVFVVTTDGEVLVHGRSGSEHAPRMVATRYWEERLFAHALAVGAITPPPVLA